MTCINALQVHDDGETILPCGSEFQNKIRLFTLNEKGEEHDAGFQTLLRFEAEYDYTVTACNLTVLVAGISASYKRHSSTWVRQMMTVRLLVRISSPHSTFFLQ